jgi:hypothetical protein
MQVEICVVHVYFQPLGYCHCLLQATVDLELQCCHFFVVCCCSLITVTAAPCRICCALPPSCPESCTQRVAILRLVPCISSDCPGHAC